MDPEGDVAIVGMPVHLRSVSPPVAEPGAPPGLSPVMSADMPSQHDLNAPHAIAGSDRLLAALSYVSVLGLVIFAAVPMRQFLARHNWLAVSLHLVRFAWVAATLAIWWVVGDHSTEVYNLRYFGADLAMLLIAGVPWNTTWSTAALPWFVTPLAVTWVLSFGGFLLAASGRTADFHAFTHADWSDPKVRRIWLSRSPEEEREMARIARERQLERLQQSTRLVTTERERRTRIVAYEEEIARLEKLRLHNDHLLGVGEISRRRYDMMQDEIDREIAELMSRIHELQSRIAMPPSVVPDRLRVHRLERDAESPLEGLTIVTPDGLPLFSYGHFALDEALVSGILSAFDSLSEEVFGSRVHKTNLAEGTVLHFAHGQWVVILAVFTDEPSPRQVEHLRKMLQQFEAANAGPLSRKAWDPAYLHEVQIPFRFADRMGRQ